MNTSFHPGSGAVLMVSLFTVFGLFACSPETDIRTLNKIEQIYLGDFLCSGGHKGIDIQGNHVHMLMNYACTPQNGVGQNLYYWSMEFGSDNEGTLVKFDDAGRGRYDPREGRTGMMDVVVDPETGTRYFIYNDRTDEYEDRPRSEWRREVYLDRYDGSSLHELFKYSNGSGVLNPMTFLAQDRSMRIFLPDRTARYVRRFKMDLQTEEVERLDDIPLPVEGARMYDALVDGPYLIVPLAVSQGLHLARIDTRDDTFEITQIDDFYSPDGMPPRSIRIDKYEDLGIYLLNYLRPAEFSYRPDKGLTGSLVVNAVDVETRESLRTTVLAGHSDTEALPHYLYGAKFDEQRLAVAYTNLNSVHEWHIGEGQEHANYISSQLEIWKINEDGHVEREARHVFEEPFWDVVLGVLEDQTIFISYNSTTESNEKWVEFFEY